MTVGHALRLLLARLLLVRSLLAITSALVFALGTAACQSVQPAADIVLTNGKIYTVDDDIPWASAIAVSAGRIQAIGDDDDLSARIGPATTVVDLDGRLVLPAFGDAHIHPVLGGTSFAQCSIHDGATVEEYLAMVSECIEEAPGDGVLYGRGWSPGLFPPVGVPHKSLLDEVAPDRPVILKSTGGHSIWLNSKALELAGITKDTPDPPNGRIDRDPETGEAVGGLQEAAMDLVAAYIPMPTDEQYQEEIVYAVDHFNRLGITNWVDAGVEVKPDGSSRIIDAYSAVQQDGKLSMNVTVSLKWENDRGKEQIETLLLAAERARTQGIRADSVKFYLDGVLVQRTAAVLEPYIGTDDEFGELQIPLDDFFDAVSALDAQGFQIFVHAIGDRAVREALNAIEESQSRGNEPDERHLIAHLNLIDPDDQPRFGELGVAANFQPLWASDNPYMRLTAEQVGEERMQHTYPANSILSSGGRLAYGADWPVASANPFEGLEVAVSRREPGMPDTNPLYEHESVTLEDAIRAYTIDVAHVTELAEETGSLTVGKSADLVVVDQDIFSIPTHEISRTEVLITLFRGQVVFGGWSRL